MEDIMEDVLDLLYNGEDLFDPVLELQLLDELLLAQMEKDDG